MAERSLLRVAALRCLAFLSEATGASGERAAMQMGTTISERMDWEVAAAAEWAEPCSSTLGMPCSRTVRSKETSFQEAPVAAEATMEGAELRLAGVESSTSAVICRSPAARYFRTWLMGEPGGLANTIRSKVIPVAMEAKLVEVESALSGE